ncbi:hypothetical protein PR048_006255 [Dryococelus australis]|uniref:DDE-1 domain-containing protein n=1 Tax=Dryococelus australis TaxID=614101 RepID=A0ABQ9IAE9_9NEOP|nr:hypothetical protein PR048_006255 [Dryococelus australis]
MPHERSGRKHKEHHLAYPALRPRIALPHPTQDRQMERGPRRQTETSSCACSSSKQGKREIPEKTHQQAAAASSCKIPTCENPELLRLAVLVGAHRGLLDLLGRNYWFDIPIGMWSSWQKLTTGCDSPAVLGWEVRPLQLSGGLSSFQGVRLQRAVSPGLQLRLDSEAVAAFLARHFAPLLWVYGIKEGTKVSHAKDEQAMRIPTVDVWTIKMPKKDIKKKPPQSWSLVNLQKVMQEVKDKRHSYSQAYLKYNIPKTTIFLRVHDSRDITDSQLAQKPCNLPRDVNLIEVAIIARSEWGFPIDKKELCDLVQEYVTHMGRKTCFVDNRPGDDWYYHFMRDHPRISLRNQKIFKRGVEEYGLQECNYLVFNCDKTELPTYPSKTKALGKKGKKEFSRIIGGTGRENIFVSACVSAKDERLPPLIIFKRKAVQAGWTSSEDYPGTMYSASDKSSHSSVRIIQLALENKIVLVRLPHYITHIMPPLDKRVFGPVKTAWDRILVCHGKKTIGKSQLILSKETFSKLLRKVWHVSMTPELIKAGFRETGCYPMNQKKFPEHYFKRDVEWY